MLKPFNNNQSVKARFITTTIVNIIRAVFGIVTGIIIARNLGPSSYGNFNFLLGSFISIIMLLDMGTSSAFYTFISQRKRGPKFYLYYFLWIGIQFTIVLFFIGVIFPDVWRSKIWLGHPKGLIMLAFVASFMMNKVWQIITCAGESIRATVIVQLYNIVILGLYLCVVIVMIFLYRFTISNLFIIIAFTYLLFSLILAKRLKDNLIVREEVRLANMINEFKIYCTPLIVFGIVGFLYLFTDTWLLQKFSGAAQQGFYSVGLRFSSICLISTTSILKIFWKEIAEANEAGNKERLHQLYAKVSRGLCFISATVACFLIPFSKEILVFLLGPKYEDGWLCLTIMFLYPIYQSLGQINGSYFYATAQTKLYTKISIINMLVSIPFTYFILANSSAMIPGFNLGSMGLALKMVVLAIIGVNISAYFISKVSNWKFDFLYQFAIIGLLLAASFVSKGFVSWFFRIFDISFLPLISIVSCAPMYILAVGVIMYIFPELSGLEKRQVRNAILYLNKIVRKVRHTIRSKDKFSKN